MNQAFFIAGLCAAFLSACERPPRVTQDWGYTIHGLHVSVPPDPQGTVLYTIDRAEWNLQGATLTVERQPDGTFKLLRNGNLLGTAKAGDHVEFTADGRLIHKPANAK